MLIDAAQLSPGAALTAHFCVVGSGMGGSVVAQKLFAARHDVLIVEAGGLKPAKAGREPVSAEHTGRSFNMPLTRCIELGGTSNQWHGVCAPLDPLDFEPRAWIPRSGWPIAYDELQRFYEDAARLLDIPHDAFSAPATLQLQYRSQIAEVGFDSALLQSKFAYVRRPPMRWKAALRQLAAKGLRCLINAPALELVTSNGGTRVEKLLVGGPQGICRIQAEIYVICCGGLETPRLLLNSNKHHGGIGNEYDQLGRNLMDHPAGHFCKLRFHRKRRAPLYSGTRVNARAELMSGLRVRAEVQQQHSLANHYVWLRPSVTAARIDDELMLSFLRVRGLRDLSMRQVKGILTNPDILYRVLVHRFSFQPSFAFGDLWFMTEQLPNLDSRVNLSPIARDRFGYAIAGVRWHLSEEDLRGFHAFTKLLFDSGLRSEEHELARRDDPSLWERHVASAAHHLGTARMASHPREGVVDKNLKIFGISNAYVCDGSVFATAGSANPSLTIIALGLRLAEHLSAGISKG